VTAPSRPFVTVVSGVPRSGTSMMMSMLEAGGIPPQTDRLRAADLDNPRGYYEEERVKRLREDASWVKEAVGRALKVVHVHVANLPPGLEYRVVLMRRDLDEVVKSQRVMLERRGKGGGDLSDERLAQIYARQLAELEAWLAGRPGFRVLSAHYNRIVERPDPAILALDAFLGGGLDVEAMRRVVDPSLHRND
jgi:hypothetical protein